MKVDLRTLHICIIGSINRIGEYHASAGTKLLVRSQEDGTQIDCRGSYNHRRGGEIISC